MKKTLVLLFCVALLFLAACGAPAATSSSGGASQVASGASASPASGNGDVTAPSVAADTSYSAQGGAGTLTLLPYGAQGNSGAEIVLTLSQQQQIAAEIENILVNYISGDYPLPQHEGAESSGFYAQWPANVDIPHEVQPSQLRFVTEGYDGEYILGAHMPLQNGWEIRLALLPQQADYTQTDTTWEVAAVLFEQT